MATKKIRLASLFLLLSILACRLPVSKEESQALKENYFQLRNIWFTTKPEDLAITADKNSKEPYAIIMDMGISQATVTIASSIVGDGSMYTSTGGGVIGGIDHENVRQASIHFVEFAADFVDRMVLVTEFPLPADGNIKFYLITPSGVYTTEEVNADVLTSGNHELSPLYLAGDDVITQLRIITEQ